MADEFEVDPKALERAASGTGTSRGELKTAGALALDETTTAASKLTGWKTAGGLAAMRQRWEEQMTGLDTSMAELAERFRLAAGNYTGTDGAVNTQVSSIRKAFG